MKSEEPLFVPLVKIYSNQANVFYYNKNRRVYPKEQGLNLLEDRKKAYQGKMSDGARRVIKERLTAWYFIINMFNKLPANMREGHFKRLVFITITLSSEQRHSDKWIKENMLELFLKRLQYNYGIQDYFWKAEKQKNGNIHFHIVVDSYIDKYEIQRHWNDVQDGADYITPFYSKYKHKNPPSTDVEVVSDKERAIDYLMKYVSKKEQSIVVQGRLFSFSSRLLKLCIPAVEIDAPTGELLQRFHRLSGFNLIEEPYFSVLRWKNDYDLMNSNLEGARYLQEFYGNLVKLLYLTDADETALDSYIKIYCNFYDFKLKEDRYSLLLQVAPYIALKYPI